MDLNTPYGRPRAQSSRLVVAKQAAGWTPFQSRMGVSLLGGEHSDEEIVEEPARHRNFGLVPYEADYSPEELVDPSAGYIAVLSEDKLKKAAPVILWLKRYEANKKKAQTDIERLTLKSDEQSKTKAIRSVQQASAAYLALLTHVFDTIHGPNASPIEPTREERLRVQEGVGHPYQRMSVKYKVFSLRPGAGGVHNQRPTQGVETWTCTMPWSLARDTVGTSQHEMYWRNIYLALHESCPRYNKRLGRIKYLLHQGLKDSFFSRADKHTGLRGHAETPQSTLDTRYFNWTATDSAGHTHSLVAGALDVRECADHMVPQIFDRFRAHLQMAAKAHAKTQVSNLFSLALRIDAPVSEDAHVWESHVLELTPYAGEDACTVNHIFLDSRFRESGVNGFCYKHEGLHGKSNEIEHRQQDGGELDHVQGMVCVGAHRGLRYKELDLLKLHAQGHEKYWWKDSRQDLGHASIADSYAARVSIEDWDFVFSSFRVKRERKAAVYKDGKTDIGSVWDEEIKSVITAVHYPPYITNNEQRTSVPRLLLKREEGKAEPFFVHLVVGDVTSRAYKDEERNYLYYVPFLTTRRSHLNRVDAKTPMLEGLDLMEQDFRRIRKAVSTQFMDVWPRGGRLHQSLLLLSKKRDASSALHMWAQGWRMVVWESMQALGTHGPEHLHGSGSLLQYGYWRLSSQIPEREQRQAWLDILMDGGCPTPEIAKQIYEAYTARFLPRHFPEGLPGLEPPKPRSYDSSSESDVEGRLGMLYRPATQQALPLLAKLSHIERRLAQSEQSANVKHLLERVLTRLDGGSDAP
jgi:hypothetical protein